MWAKASSRVTAASVAHRRSFEKAGVIHSGCGKEKYPCLLNRQGYVSFCEVLYTSYRTPQNEARNGRYKITACSGCGFRIVREFLASYTAVAHRRETERVGLFLAGHAACRLCLRASVESGKANVRRNLPTGEFDSFCPAGYASHLDLSASMWRNSRKVGSCSGINPRESYRHQRRFWAYHTTPLCRLLSSLLIAQLVLLSRSCHQMLFSLCLD